MKVTTDACLFGAWVAQEISQLMPKTVLDIGAGTGLLSLMIRQKNSKVRITGIELDEDAYKEAKENIENSAWRSSIELIQGAVQEYQTNNKYEVIVSNPPFYRNSFKGRNERKNRALHSSHLPMEDLAEHVSRLLANHGTFYLLYPEEEMQEFIQIASIVELYPAALVTVRNEVEKSVFRQMAKFEMKEIETIASEIIIRKPDQKYTDTFWALLKDYYLEYNDPNRE